ncbi:MAG: FAD-binding protein, partial [Thermoguttaceae bacterium]
MTTATAEFLPLRTTTAPPDEAALAAEVRRAAAERCPVYPMGGATRLDYGTVPEVPGVGLSTADLNRIVDHAADDMTITV